MNKPWKSYNEQLAILISRGLSVSDHYAALDYLDRIGYYRLSGYWYPFRKLLFTTDENGAVQHERLNQFYEGASFEDAVQLYVFDKKLRMLALDALERIELSIRVDVAHLLGERDIYAYTNPDLFHGNFSKRVMNGKTKHNNWLEKHDKLLHRARNEPFVKHYREKYGRLPIWVAIEVWDFGMLSTLFSGLKVNDKHSIAQKYGIESGALFQKWLRSLNFIRNVSAHHSRLWNINILERSPVYHADPYWSTLSNDRPFYYFCVIQMLLKVICQNSSWKHRFKALLSEFPDLRHCDISLANFGTFDNWELWDLWADE